MPFGTVADATRNNDANRKLAKGITRRNFKRGKQKKTYSLKQGDTIEPLQFGSNSDTVKRIRRRRFLTLLFLLGLGVLSIVAIQLLA